MKKLKLEHKHVIILTAIVIIAICISIIAIFQEASQRWGWRFDMTDSKLYVLSQSTDELLDDILNPISVTVFSSEEEYFGVAAEILSRYEDGSDMITVEYADPYTQPMILDYFHDRGILAEQNDVVFQSGNRSHIVKLTQLYTTDSSGQTVTTITAEQVFSSAIHSLTRTQQLKVMMSAGHNETASPSLLTLLTNNGFEVQDRSISVSGIEEGTDMIIIANPSRDFEQVEVEELSQYMDDGGTVLIFLGASASQMPILESFMQQYGLGTQQATVLDQTLKADNNAVNVIGVFMNHSINSYFIDNQYYPVLPQSRPIIVSQQVAPNIDISPLIISSDSSYSKQYDDLSNIQQQQTDPTGPFILSAISEKTLDEGKKSTLILTSSGHLYADDIMSISSYANREFLVQMLGYCTPGYEMLNIPAKQVAVGSVAVLPSHIWGLAVGVVIACALLLAVGSGYISRRKRI